MACPIPPEAPVTIPRLPAIFRLAIARVTVRGVSAAVVRANYRRGVVEMGQGLLRNPAMHRHPALIVSLRQHLAMCREQRQQTSVVDPRLHVHIQKTMA